jgi:hypothetical protein
MVWTWTGTQFRPPTGPSTSAGRALSSPPTGGSGAAPVAQSGSMCSLAPSDRLREAGAFCNLPKVQVGIRPEGRHAA